MSPAFDSEHILGRCLPPQAMPHGQLAWSIKDRTNGMLGLFRVLRAACLQIAATKARMAPAPMVGQMPIRITPGTRHAAIVKAIANMTDWMAKPTT